MDSLSLSGGAARFCTHLRFGTLEFPIFRDGPCVENVVRPFQHFRFGSLDFVADSLDTLSLTEEDPRRAPVADGIPFPPHECFMVQLQEEPTPAPNRPQTPPPQATPGGQASGGPGVEAGVVRLKTAPPCEAEGSRHPARRLRFEKEQAAAGLSRFERAS